MVQNRTNNEKQLLKKGSWEEFLIGMKHRLYGGAIFAQFRNNHKYSQYANIKKYYCSKIYFPTVSICICKCGKVDLSE